MRLLDALQGKMAASVVREPGFSNCRGSGLRGSCLHKHTARISSAAAVAGFGTARRQWNKKSSKNHSSLGS